MLVINCIGIPQQSREATQSSTSTSTLERRLDEMLTQQRQFQVLCVYAYLCLCFCVCQCLCPMCVCALNTLRAHRLLPSGAIPWHQRSWNNSTEEANVGSKRRWGTAALIAFFWCVHTHTVCCCCCFLSIVYIHTHTHTVCCCCCCFSASCGFCSTCASWVTTRTRCGRG